MGRDMSETKTEVFHTDASDGYTLVITDDQPATPGQRYARRMRVQILRDADGGIWEMLYPAYRIHTFIAHWQENIQYANYVVPQDEIEALRTRVKHLEAEVARLVKTNEDLRARRWSRGDCG